MKTVICVILSIGYFVFLSLITNSPILLNAQPEWSEDIRLTYFFGYSYDPQAACNGDTVHLVWWEHYGVSGNLREEVFYKRSTDAGLTWEEDFRLTPEDSITAVRPSIGVWHNNIHVVWKEQTAYYYAICYRKSEDGGNTWGAIDTIYKTNMDGWYHPCISVYKNSLYLVAIKSESGGRLVFVKSTDNGNSWLPAQEITTAKNIPCIKSSKNDPSLLTVVYVNTPEIYYVISYDGGQTWLDSQMVSGDDGIGSQRPALDIDNSNGIHITWFDYKYSPYAWTGDIFYRTSKDSGGTWEEIDSLTVMHRSVASDILAENSNLHVVWEDDRNDFGDNFEIYYRMSTDLGLTWDSEVRLTDTLNWSRRPSLACASKYLHLFWFDLRDDPSNIVGEIYYKRKDLSYSIEESDKSAVADYRLYVYPNPFSQMLNIKFMHATGKAEIRIFDVYGREMAEYLTKNQPEGLTVVTRDLPCGVYFVQLDADNQRVMKKVVKIR